MHRRGDTNLILGAIALLLLSPLSLFAEIFTVANVDVKFKDGGNGTCSDVTWADTSVALINPPPIPGAEAEYSAVISSFTQPNYPGGCLALCARVTCTPEATDWGLDQLKFEIAHFGSGLNILDPGSTPAVATINLTNVGTCRAGFPSPYTIGEFCTPWNGYYGGNRVLGTYGFRATASINKVDPMLGNISIESMTPYPGANQYPIKVTDDIAASSVTLLSAYQTGSTSTLKISLRAPNLLAGSAYALQWTTDTTTVNWSPFNAQAYVSTGPLTLGTVVSTTIAGLPSAKDVYIKGWAMSSALKWSAASDIISGFSSPFSFEAIDGQSGIVGEHNATAIDALGNIHVTYRDPDASHHLRYIKWTAPNGPWSSPVMIGGATGAGTGAEMSIAIDGDNKPHISYFILTQGLYYTSCPSGSCTDSANWNIKSVETGSNGEWSSIALDGAKNIHISYAGAGGTLKYAKSFDGGTSWVKSTLLTGAGSNYTSLALDGNGNPHISFAGATPDLSFIESQDGGTTWGAPVIVDNLSPTGTWTALALDGRGRPHISYYTSDTLSLRYAKYNGATWDKTTVTPGGNGSTEFFTSLILDGTGYPHIGYRYNYNSNVETKTRYAYFNGVSWSTNTFDSLGDVGRWNSIAMDGNGGVHISYADSTNNDLKMAHWTGTPFEAPMGGNSRSRSQAPLSFAAAGVHVGSVTWSWIDNSSNEYGFRLYGAPTSTGPFQLIAGTDTITANSTSFTEGGLTPGATYFRYIAAVNEGGVVVSSGTVAVTRPLRISGISTNALGTSATDVALINFSLTEPATVYFDIYYTTTVFANPAAMPPTLSVGSLTKRISSVTAPGSISLAWDGRDNFGDIMCDGTYLYAIWAEIPLQSAPGGLLKTTTAQTGTITISRGPAVPTLTPSNTTLGATNTIAGLDPFYLRYTPRRQITSNLSIKDINTAVVRTLGQGQSRVANTQVLETWDGKDNAGNWVSSGTYFAELIYSDPYQCSSCVVSTITVALPVNLFRITDVSSIPVINASTLTASISYLLSQDMLVDFKIYPVGTSLSTTTWPWAATPSHIYISSGEVTGRAATNKHWDGRNQAGLYLPDGNYPFSLVARSTNTPIFYASDVVYGTITLNRGALNFSSFAVVKSSAQMFNSQDTIYIKPYDIRYSIPRPSSVTISVLTTGGSPQIIATLATDAYAAAGTQYSLPWDLKDNSGHYLPSGSYSVRVVATELGTSFVSMSTVAVNVDVSPLRIYDMAVQPVYLSSTGYIAYQISEPMRTVLKISKPGTTYDALLNPSPAGNLIKTIVRDIQGRANTIEYWDGRDEAGRILPDGNYSVSLAASTETIKISTSGILTAGIALASDVLSFNFPISRGEILSSSTYVSNTDETTVVLAKDVMEIRVNIDPGTFGQGVTVSITTTSVSAPSDPSIKVSPVSIQITNNLNLQPNKDIEISINYADSDIAGMDESKIAIARHNPTSGKWVVLDSTVYPGQNKVVAKTNHLSVFTLVQPSATTSLSTVRIYPNPFTPARHINGAKITNLPAEATIKVFSINGELVRTIEYTTQNGIAQWDGRNDNGSIVASGIYLILVKSDFGTKRFKIAVEK